MEQSEFAVRSARIGTATVPKKWFAPRVEFRNGVGYIIARTDFVGAEMR